MHIYSISVNYKILSDYFIQTFPFQLDSLLPMNWPVNRWQKKYWWEAICSERKRIITWERFIIHKSRNATSCVSRCNAKMTMKWIRSKVQATRKTQETWRVALKNKMKLCLNALTISSYSHQPEDFSTHTLYLYSQSSKSFIRKYCTQK